MKYNMYQELVDRINELLENEKVLVNFIRSIHPEILPLLLNKYPKQEEVKKIIESWCKK